MADVLSLHVASFNCRGYNIIKRKYIRSVLSKVSVLFLQEVWLSDGQMQELANIDDHFLFTVRSGFDNSEVLTGRPYGGVAILWRSDLAASITVIDTNSKRVCAVRMVCPPCYAPVYRSAIRTNGNDFLLNTSSFILSSNNLTYLLIWIKYQLYN